MVSSNDPATEARMNLPELDIIPLQIGGKDVYNDIFFDVTNPSTGKLLWRSCSASKSDAQAAAETA